MLKEKTRKYEDYNKEAAETLGSEQEWSTEGAQLTLHKVVANEGQSESSIQTSVVQHIALSNAQQSNYSIAIANQFRKGHFMGRIDHTGGVIGILQQSFGPLEGFLQWTKRGQMPPDMYFSSDLAHPLDDGGVLSFKFLKGMEASLQYLKTFGKRYAFGTELKYTFPLRKTISSFCCRWRSLDKNTIVTAEVKSNKEMKLDYVRRIGPNTSIVAELEHKNDTTVKIGSQVNFLNQGFFRFQLDPELKVKGLVQSTIGRGNTILQYVFQWDPSSRNFKQGIDIKLQGGVMTG